jgi:uncharacterized membrane protein
MPRYDVTIWDDMAIAWVGLYLAMLGVILLISLMRSLGRVV